MQELEQINTYKLPNELEQNALGHAACQTKIFCKRVSETLEPTAKIYKVTVYLGIKLCSLRCRSGHFTYVIPPSGINIRANNCVL